jgi:hypothetical protein
MNISPAVGGDRLVPDFISEDDLSTFEGYLRLQAADPSTATAEELAAWRKLFDEAMTSRAATSKVGAMKFKPAPGEHRYAVAVRDGGELWLTTWIRRSPKGDIYVLIPRNDSDWNPHTSYHRDGTFHSKSFRHKTLFGARKRQPLTDKFRGVEHIGMFAGHGPKTVGAICDPLMFSGVMEVPPGILGPRDGFVAVDLIEPGCEPLELYNLVFREQVFRDSVPWIVIRVGKQAPPSPD